MGRDTLNRDAVVTEEVVREKEPSVSTEPQAKRYTKNLGLRFQICNLTSDIWRRSKEGTKTKEKISCGTNLVSTLQKYEA